MCHGQYQGALPVVIQQVKAFRDIEILKSYLLLVWSEWDCIQLGGFDKMCTLIREDFSGIGMQHHREDLIEQLDHILGQLGQGYLRQHKQGLDQFTLGLAERDYKNSGKYC